MAEQVGIVIRQESGKVAWVATERKGGCGGCHTSPHGCRRCQSPTKMESRVANPVGAKPGDRVRIQLASENLYLGAAILYLLPVFGLLLGAFTGGWLSVTFGLAATSGTIGGAAAGFAFGFAAVIVLDRTSVIRRRITPTITTVLSRQSGMPDRKSASCGGHPEMCTREDPLLHSP